MVMEMCDDDQGVNCRQSYPVQSVKFDSLWRIQAVSRDLTHRRQWMADDNWSLRQRTEQHHK